MRIIDKDVSVVYQMLRTNYTLCSTDIGVIDEFSDLQDLNHLNYGTIMRRLKNALDRIYFNDSNVKREKYGVKTIYSLNLEKKY